MANRHRAFKNRLYALHARIGKGLASPHGIELIGLLAQGERTVERLVREEFGHRTGAEVIG